MWWLVNGLYGYSEADVKWGFGMDPRGGMQYGQEQTLGSRGEWDIHNLPIAPTTAILLGLRRVGVGVTGFGEESRKMLLGFSATIGKSGVVAVSELVGSSHCNVVNACH